MADDPMRAGAAQLGQKASKFLGSLKEALANASRDDTGARKEVPAMPVVATPPPLPSKTPAIPLPAPAPSIALEITEIMRKDPAPAALSAADAAREVRAQVALKPADRHIEADAPPTTRVMRPAKTEAAPPSAAKTQLVRGRQPLKRGEFSQDPVVGWLVIVGGPGLGSYRAVFEGNNTIGRNASQRIPLDFGDDTISADEQAYIRYDSAERSFLFVPNLAKTNVVSVNNKRPTAAVELHSMDVITVGRTQLVFVPFCGAEFDWSEIAETKD